MAVPAAPAEAGGNGVLFLTRDSAGTNVAGLFRGVVPRTVNGNELAYLGVATHADAQAWASGDPVVLGGVYDPAGAGTVRRMLGDATGRSIMRPQGVYNSAGTNLFGHPFLVAQTTLNSEAVGWLASATHKAGLAVAATDGVNVIAGVQGGNAKALSADASGRLLNDPNYVVGGNGALAISGTAQALRSSTACRKVRITTNTGSAVAYIGISTVTAGVTATGGYQLPAGASVDVETTNTNLVFVIGTTGSVSYLWFV